MALFDKVKGVMNVRNEVIKQLGFPLQDSTDNQLELLVAIYTLAVCTREISIDTISVDAYTYSER